MEYTMEKIIDLSQVKRLCISGIRDIRRTCEYLGLWKSWSRIKNNVKKAWWLKFVQESPYNVGVDCAILYEPADMGRIGTFEQLFGSSYGLQILS